MNRLYYITVYNSSQNQYARFAITVRETQGIQTAEKEAVESAGMSWRVHSSVFVCTTPDDVFTEL